MWGSTALGCWWTSAEKKTQNPTGGCKPPQLFFSVGTDSVFFRVPTLASVADYEPRRPDFMEVAGGLLARTGGGVGGCGCWALVASGTAWDGACGPFFFLEKSGISFFRFTESTSSRG